MDCYNKVVELRKMVDRAGHGVLIQVDGGVDTKNASKLVKAGVDVIVAGNAIFSSNDPAETILKLKRLVK
jgi:ribulose-phosphate 3-epimerase